MSDMQLSMHEGYPKNNPCSSETGDYEFEEMMCSAFRTGVKLLSEPESDLVRRQGEIAENPSKSAPENMEGTGWVPKNVTRLKPVLDKLMCKDLPKGADQQWRMKAKTYIQWVQDKVSSNEEHLKGLLTQLEEIAAEEYQLDLSNGETDRS